MAMTTASMNPPVPENQKVVNPTTEQLKAAVIEAEKIKAASEAEVYASAKAEETAEDLTSKKQLQQEQEVMRTGSSKNISELTEADAYNFDVYLSAKNSFAPDFLTVIMRDKNYVARWICRHPLSLSKAVGKGFKFVRTDEVENLSELEVFLDASQQFVWVDLVLMKLPKNVYYAGIRAAYQKSLAATNERMAAKAGAAYAASSLRNSMDAGERAYQQQHEQTNGGKQVYNPIVGV